MTIKPRGGPVEKKGGWLGFAGLHGGGWSVVEDSEFTKGGKITARLPVYIVTK